MPLWIPITLAAAFFQNVRSALQKHLKGSLSNNGATIARFLYAVPFAFLYLALLVGFGFELPEPNAKWLGLTALGGIAQILATAALLATFGYRNFAVGTTYSKTEPLQIALFGIVLLGEPLTLQAFIAIIISFVGVVLLSSARSGLSLRQIATDWTARPALLGIVSGSLFGISFVCFRGAALSLGDESFLIRAAFTLGFATLWQTVVMSVYMRVREPGELGRVFGAWRVAGWVGFTGMLASAGWFTAATLHNAAYVRALGQVELVFTFAASTLLFREKSSAREVFAIALVIVGIVILLLGQVH